MNTFNTADLMDSLLLQQAVYCQQKDINMPETLQERLDEATVEEKAEIEIGLIQAEYSVEQIIGE